MLYFTSMPNSPSSFEPCRALPSCLLVPSRYGVNCRLRCAGIARPDNVPASDTRFRSYCRGSGAQYAGLVATADVALKVDAPLLHVARGKAKRAERNGELRAPATLEHLRFNLPGAIPVDVEPAARAAGLTATASTAAPTSATATAAAALLRRRHHRHHRRRLVLRRSPVRRTRCRRDWCRTQTRSADRETYRGSRESCRCW